MKFVCLSDTHNQHQQIEVPDGDVLIHAGDFCGRGDLAEARSFLDWFRSQPHQHKVLVAGNHDKIFEKDPAAVAPYLHGMHYLFDSHVEIDGLKIYGSPWQPWFFNWAFNLQRGEPLREKWRLIPNDVDILITHGPMFGFGDRTSQGLCVGCEDLRDEVLERVKPRYHACGHIHEGRGVYQTPQGVTSVNASCLTHRYKNYELAPICFELAAQHQT